jgi:hypothetical protein
VGIAEIINNIIITIVVSFFIVDYLRLTVT